MPALRGPTRRRSGRGLLRLNLKTLVFVQRAKRSVSSLRFAFMGHESQVSALTRLLGTSYSICRDHLPPCTTVRRASSSRSAVRVAVFVLCEFNSSAALFSRLRGVEGS